MHYRLLTYFLFLFKDAQPSKPGSILDKDPAAKAMLSMINKGPLSEGIREEDAKASSPEQHDIGPIGL